jgi:hypothetical protein
MQWSKEKGQTIIYRKLKFEQHEPYRDEVWCPGSASSSVSTNGTRSVTGKRQEHMIWELLFTPVYVNKSKLTHAHSTKQIGVMTNRTQFEGVNTIQCRKT